MLQEERQIGHYRLHKLLEHGTIADAYLATHILNNNSVVVPVFPPAMSKEQIAQFMAYIRACAHLEHPDILRLLDFGLEGGEDSSTLFLVTEVPGETLRQRHPQGLPVPLDTIALYVSQIASALQFAHERQVLHLDLRPEQLFVGPDGQIVLDYTHRLLYAIDPTFIPTDALYMPHESPDPSSDQYALAMIVYEWLSGTRPFSNTTSEATGEQRTLPDPGEPASSIWSQVKPVLNQALSIDPAQRYENVQTFADELVRALNVGPEAARQWQEIRSSSGKSSFTFGASTTWTTGYQPTTMNWHNPFSTGFVFTMHNISTMAFSPDSKRLAFSSHEPAVYVAELTEPGTIFTYQGHTGQASAFAWSPDGQAIASIGSNETTDDIQIWEATTGKLLATYNVPSSQYKLQWSPDGRFIATGGWDGSIHIWQPLTGNALLAYSGHANNVTSIAWSPDSTRIASASWGEVQVWEVASGTLICTYRGHFDWVQAIAWSPDGTKVASGGIDKTIQIWNAATRAALAIHRSHASEIKAIGWSPDGNYIITGARNNNIQAIDAKDGTTVFHYHPHVMRNEHMSSIAWSPDLSILAIGGEDRHVEIANRNNGKLLICRAPAAPIELIGQSEVLQSEPMTTTSSTSISSGETTTTTTITTTTALSGPPVVHTTTSQHRTVRTWGGKDTLETVLYLGHASVAKPLAWSPDSSRIASGGYDGSIHVWDAVTSTTIFIYRGHLDPVAAIAWSPDGTRLASGSLDHTVKVWDVLTGRELLTYHGHTNFVQAVAWSPDSTRIVSGSADNTVQVWDASSGQTILTYHEHTAAINSMDWSADGQRIASGSDDQTVHIWEAATGNNIFVYRNHAAAVLVVAWSPDGQRLASGSARIWRNFAENRPDHEATLHIWEATAEPTASIYALDQHPGMPRNTESLSWSPDGQMIATPDTPYARIYDTNTGEAMAIIWNHLYGQQPDKLLAIAWSPDGTHIAGSFANGQVQVWPAREQSN